MKGQKGITPQFLTANNLFLISLTTSVIDFVKVTFFGLINQLLTSLSFGCN